MTVKELIIKLLSLPMDSRITFYMDNYTNVDVEKYEEPVRIASSGDTDIQIFEDWYNDNHVLFYITEGFEENESDI